MDPDSIQLISAAVTPAVMVSACGLIALGLDNQVGRMTTRMRDMLRERRGLGADAPRARRIAMQVRIIERRHRLLVGALALTYASLLAFVLTSLLSLARWQYAVTPRAPVVAFTAGVVGLSLAAVLAAGSLALSRSAIQLEVEELSETGSAEAGP